MSGITLGFDAKRAMLNKAGLGNYSRFIINALSQNDDIERIVLFSPINAPESPLQEIMNRNGRKITLVTAPERSWKSWWRTFGITSELNGIDIYHGLSNELPLNIHHAKGCRSIVTIHDTIWRTMPHTYHLFDRLVLYDFKYGNSCRNADHIIAISECTKRDIIRFYDIAPEKISVIYQGFDQSFSKIASDSEKQKVRVRYSLPARFILSVGTIQERKNCAILAQSLQFLPPEFHLVLIGKSTSYAQKVQEAAGKAGASDRLHILNGVPSSDLPAIYQCASVFSFPSRYEGFGIPIIEAMASGIPVVAATGSCLEEAGGPGSLYVNPDDVHGFADAICTALDPESRRRMIEAGRQWIHQFSPEVISENLIQCYRQMLV